MASSGTGNTSSAAPSVTEADPQVPVVIPVTEPTVLTTRKKVTDSEPLDESAWLSPATERPYAEAITPQHREFLKASGVPVPDLEK